jgi:heme exporter protein A
MLGPGQFISLSQVECTRSGRTIFSGLSLSLSSGQAALITGPNGVGKSSLLRIIAGLLTCTAGEVRVGGQVAFADERLAMDEDRSLISALSFWSDIDGGDAARALERVALAPLAHMPIRILSTGQRKRAALARVIASGAPIWLLDEPANGLDDEAQDRLTHIIAEHRAGGGIAIVATHLSLDIPDTTQIKLTPQATRDQLCL